MDGAAFSPGGKEYQSCIASAFTAGYNKTAERSRGSAKRWTRFSGKSETTSGLSPYSQQQLNNWANSKNITVYRNDAQLRAFVEDAKAGRNLNKKLYFGTISSSLARRIKTETGLELGGYNCTLRASEVRKILLGKHGDQAKEALQGQRAITEDDFARIPDIIQNPDSIELSPKLFEGKPVILFKKTADGKVTIVSYVSGKHMDLTVQTMYAGAKKEALPLRQVRQRPPRKRPKRLVVQLLMTTYHSPAKKARPIPPPSSPAGRTPAI